MVEVLNAVRGCPESVGFVNDDLGFVVRSFHGVVIDRHAEAVRGVILVAAHHPGEVSDRRQPGMGGPPEPALEARTAVQE